MPPVSLFGIISAEATAEAAGPVNAAGILHEAQSIKRVGLGVACPDTDQGVWWLCPRDGTRLRLVAACHRWECPKCLRRNAWRGAGRVQAKLDGIRLLVGAQALRHVVVSERRAPATTPKELTEYHVRARKILRFAGFQGGVTVFHPERHEGSKCWREGPHVHALVWGWNNNNRLDGAVVKVVGPRPEIRPTVAYMLDHAGYSGRGGNVVRYFGSAIRADVPSLPRQAAEVPLCPLCMLPMVLEDQPDGTAGAWRPERVGWSS